MVLWGEKQRNRLPCKCENLESSVVMEKSIYQCDCRQVDEGASKNDGDQNRKEVQSTETKRGGRMSDKVAIVDARVENEVANPNKDTSTSNKAAEDEKKSWVSETIAEAADYSLEKPNDEGNNKLKRCMLERKSSNLGVGRTITLENDICTPGFIKSINGSEGERPNINLEVVIGEAHQKKCVVGPSEVPIPISVYPTHAPNFICNHIVQAHTSSDYSSSTQGTKISSSLRKINGGSYGEPEGIRKVKRRPNRKGQSFPNFFQRGAIFRAASAAISLLISQNSHFSRISRRRRRRRKLLEEAKLPFILVSLWPKEKDVIRGTEECKTSIISLIS